MTQPPLSDVSDLTSCSQDSWRTLIPPPAQTHAAFAVFDLDLTLIPIDTGDVWVRYVALRAKFDYEALSQTLDRFVREYRLGTLDIDEFMDFQMRFLARVPPEALLPWTEEYMKTCVEPAINLSARNLVAACRDLGWTTLICSATHSWVSGNVGALFGVDAVLAATPQHDAQGRFTGRIAGTHSYQTGKIRHLLAYLNRVGVKTEDASFAFYSDSAADLPLFEFVQKQSGLCFCVHPSPALSCAAQKQHWTQARLYSPDEMKQAQERVEATLCALTQTEPH